MKNLDLRFDLCTSYGDIDRIIFNAIRTVVEDEDRSDHNKVASVQGLLMRQNKGYKELTRRRSDAYED